MCSTHMTAPHLQSDICAIENFRRSAASQCKVHNEQVLMEKLLTSGTQLALSRVIM